MNQTLKSNRWLRENAMLVLDTVVDSIIIIDSVGGIHYANGASYRMFGFEPGSLVGKNVTELMPESFRAGHESHLSRYLRTREAHVIGIGRELPVQTADGRHIPCYLAVSEIPTAHGMFFAGILRDLTKEKQAQAAVLEQQERLARVGRLSTMGEMTASIAHEINQPLTAISMYAQACLKLLQMPSFDREKLSAALDKLNRQSLRAGAIIERIQRFVRNESGQRELCDIGRLVRDVGQFARGDARLNELELRFDLAEDLPPVWCDPVQVQQVALNLVRNAIDAVCHVHRAHGDLLTIRGRRVDDWVEVSVIDAGSGVSADDEPLIFSAFHSTKKDGMGMGLSICRSIINQHGGQLGFFNNPDHGATFYFRLPVGEEQES